MRHHCMTVSLLLTTVCCLPVAANNTAKLWPTAANSYWKKHVPEAMRNDYIRLGNQYKGIEWKAINPSLFAEFKTNGNRTNYETESFAVRKRFTCLVMAEIMQHKGIFIPDIQKGLHYFIEQEPWWGLPAHYPHPQPQRDVQVVDLFNAETASMLAWATYMLGNEIDKSEHGLCDSIKSEIERRFLYPTLHQQQGWKHNANNWNTWITSNWLECIMLCEKNGQERDKAIAGVKENLKLFLKGYPDDGGCEEGIDYWDRAGASFFESLYFLNIIGEPLALTTAEQEKVHNMGSFITTMHIHDLSFVNYSDAKSKSLPNINILFPFGYCLNDKDMMEFAAFIGDKYHYLTKPSALFLRTGNYPPLGRELLLLSMIDKYKATKAAQPQTIDCYLQNSQIMIASTNPATGYKHSWLVSAKGGHNGESHNHNDIGNFIVYYDYQPVIIDLGRDTYTSQTFGNRRYEMINNRSAYHNVPIINGFEQHNGRSFKATNVSHSQTDSVSDLQLNIEKAYDKRAHANYWQRNIALNRKLNRVEITECYCIDSIAAKKDEQAGKPTCQQLVLVCYGQPTLQKEGIVLLHNNLIKLHYDSNSLTASIEKVNMTDGIMKKQWQDNVYRIVLRTQEGSYQANLKYWLE